MPDATESTAAAFARYQSTAASRLRYEQARRNLRKLHALDRPLSVLDAGGGDGQNARFLLDAGHQVTLYDADPGMLERAAAALGPAVTDGRCTLVEGTLEGISRRLDHTSFDLILCHHVIEYLADGSRALADLRALAAEGGELSLVTLNPVSEVIRAAVFEQDPALARDRLTDRAYDARWFGRAQLYPEETIVSWAEAAGWSVRGLAAIRVLADYLPEGGATTAATERETLELEDALAFRDPYRHVGRYLQFCFAAASRQKSSPET